MTDLALHNLPADISGPADSNTNSINLCATDNERSNDFPDVMQGPSNVTVDSSSIIIDVGSTSVDTHGDLLLNDRRKENFIQAIQVVNSGLTNMGESPDQSNVANSTVIITNSSKIVDE